MNTYKILFKPGMPPAAGCRAPGFLKLLLSTNVCMLVCVCVFVCVCAPRLLITSDVMWCDYDWLNKFYDFICSCSWYSQWA